MKKAFVFDLFGTLVKVFEKQAYVDQIQKLSDVLDVDYETFYQKWNIETYDERMTGKFSSIHENISHILDALDIDRTDEEIQKAVHFRMEFVKRSLDLHRDHLHDTLDNIKSRGYKIGLISDCSPDVPVLWETVGFKKYFDSVVFSCEVGMKKPDPRIYKKAIDALGVDFEDCYYIGDGGSNELTGAFEVGMHPILIKSIEDEMKNVRKKQADSWAEERIYCLSELKNYT